MKDLVNTIAELRRLTYADLEERKEIQEYGVTVLPVNFYATTPSIKEVLDSFEYRESMPYLSKLFDPGTMSAVLDELRVFAGELQAPMDDDDDDPAGFFWNNSQFGYSDAAAYYAFVRARKPKRIIEVGAGFSTLAASAAIEANGSGEIICVEPYPRPFLKKVPHVAEVVEMPVQMLDAEWFNERLDDGDILFIDSTHTVKAGSDCVHLYLRLLPFLRRKLLVHVHDIFLPEAMPQEWALKHHIYWTEQYVLLAYLLDNPKTSVLFGSNYHRLENPEALREMLPEAIEHGGSSFWFGLDPQWK